MRYKIGDKVRIKSLGWYKDNKNEFGLVNTLCTFTIGMQQYCGDTAIIKKCNKDRYRIDVDNGCYEWDDDMFEDIDTTLEKRNIEVSLETAKK